MRASQLAHANTLIRFIGYKPRPGVSDEQFIAAWRAIAENVPQPAGIIYRELCRQVPAWNDQVTQEIQNTNPYDFIDYAILWPDYDRAELLSLPDEIVTRYELTTGLFRIVHPFVKPDLPGEPETILWNCFEINAPPVVEQGFVLGWPARADYQSQQEGFFSAMLHLHTQPDARITAFNRAEWQSASTYARTVADFDRLFPTQGRTGGPADPQAGPPPVRSYLGLYRIVGRFQQQTTRILPKMHAVVMRGYGGPEVLHYEETVRPVPGPDQILLRIHAVGINPLDAKMRSGEVKTLHPTWPEDILGFDLAGVVEAVGSEVTERSVGEEVYGSASPLIRRGYAEYAVVPARLFQPKPKNLSFVQAAVIPAGVYTAHNALFEMAKLHAGQRVLIHGASGVVGSFAVQLAKQAGAYVIAITSTPNLEKVSKLGADEVIDYRTQKFEELVAEVDVVLDTVGDETRARSWQTLKSGGTLVTLVPPLPDPTLAATYSVRAMMNQNTDSRSTFSHHVTSLLESGQLSAPEAGLVLPLHETPQAHTLLDQRVVSGRIVLQVD